MRFLAVFKLPRSGHFFAAQSAKKRRFLVVQRESYASIAEEGRVDSARRPEGRTRARLFAIGTFGFEYPAGTTLSATRPHPNIKVTTNSLCEARSRGGGSPPRCPRGRLSWR